MRIKEILSWDKEEKRSRLEDDLQLLSHIQDLTAISIEMAKAIKMLDERLYTLEARNGSLG